MKSFIGKHTGTLAGLLLSIIITAGVFLLVLASFFYLYLPGVTNHGETITVPSIVGMPISNLEEFLVDRSLRYEVNDSSFSETYPPLTVLKQYPEPGTKVKESRKIFISVNRIKPPTVPVPNLIDGSLVNADEVLRSNELKRGRIELIRGPFLHVVNKMKHQGKEIEPGTRIPKGSVIDLVVQDGGTDKFPMPNVLGYTLDESKTTLFGSNLNIGEVTAVGDTTGFEPVLILKQKPKPQETVRAGDVVELWIGEPGTPIPEDEEN